MTCDFSFHTLRGAVVRRLGPSILDSPSRVVSSRAIAIWRYLDVQVSGNGSIRTALAAAGFPMVRFDPTGNREFGVVHAPPCALPVIVSRAPFALYAESVTELVEQVSAARAFSNALKMSRWLRLGRALGVGPDLGK